MDPVIDVPPSARPAVLTHDPQLLEVVLAASAAAGVEPVVVNDVAALDRLADPPSVLILGVDQAPEVSRRLGPRRVPVHLVGADREELCRWSPVLGASVVMVPSDLPWLTAAVAGGPRAGQAVTVGVVGGSGGIGVTTFAAGLATSAGVGGAPTLLIDLDPVGGGADLVLGLDRVEGWRWPGLAAAHGYLGDLHQRLPRLAETAVLAYDRAAPSRVDGSAVATVLRSASRVHRLVVVDLGRGAEELQRVAARLCTGVFLVCGDDVRAVAAAEQVLRRLDRGTPVAVVVRRGHPAAAAPVEIGQALGVPLAGEVPEDRRLREAGIVGEPPLSAAGRPWRRACRRIATGLLEADRGR